MSVEAAAVKCDMLKFKMRNIWRRLSVTQSPTFADFDLFCSVQEHYRVSRPLANIGVLIFKDKGQGCCPWWAVSAGACSHFNSKSTQFILRIRK